MYLQQLYLKKDEERRLKAGHLWLYSNEIDTKLSPLKNFSQGELVHILSSRNKSLGLGYINPNNLLCVRLLTKNSNTQIDKNFFMSRINEALKLRKQFFSQNYYRLVYGESDELPGLVVDRFEDVLVVQISTAGMEKFKDEIVNALKEILQPTGILWRNDNQARDIENLPKYVEVAYGQVPNQIEINEHGFKFLLDLWKGQKTGWFFDQSYNRVRLVELVSYIKPARVLDVFSYIGAWGIQAARSGAGEVVCVDSSHTAAERVISNAELNNISDKLKVVEQDAFLALQEMQKRCEIFDLIILDPPAFIKRRKDLAEGLRAYIRIHELALTLLKSNGVLFTTSCSMHLQRDMLLDALRQAALKVGCRISIVEQLHQAQDHPIHPAIPETEYLKGFVCAVIK